MEFIEAVDGHLFNENEIKQHTRPLNYAFLKGEVGCALSHQKIYKKMIADNIDQAVIFEDDISLPDNIADIIEHIKIDNKKSSIVLLSRVNRFRTKPLKTITQNYKLHKMHQATTAHAYIINKKTAQNMLDFMYPVWMVADKWDFFEDHSIANIDCIIPAPVVLNDFSLSSTINIDNESNTIHKKKKEIWGKIIKKRPLLAKIKHRYRRAIVPLFSSITVQKKGA
ncbi:glycosyltransferase family 25 protein [Enterobacteriaceae bacterium H20N1]|uniref:Glycosyltransferase family 25 protein n=1 Tax=Dryocola boscaweniae TaxID=2925397 RepID=A0A9X2W5P9_9ENTR|nr:glycosyltransferase family 25 protein [Dryocola boscaweniae]MCT4701513.1 glycosyltransferase family 25 protein [Dryocola boscaweniae]MCT4718576.1 glycosyltransferase family 25 protein [Dryocola boscaweniae]